MKNLYQTFQKILLIHNHSVTVAVQHTEADMKVIVFIV